MKGGGIPHLNKRDPEGDHPLNGGGAPRFHSKQAHVEGQRQRIHDDEQPSQVLGAPGDAGQAFLFTVVENAALEENLPFEEVQRVRLRALEQECFLQQERDGMG